MIPMIQYDIFHHRIIDSLHHPPSSDRFAPKKQQSSKPFLPKSSGEVISRVASRWISWSLKIEYRWILWNNWLIINFEKKTRKHWGYTMEYILFSDTSLYSKILGTKTCSFLIARICSAAMSGNWRRLGAPSYGWFCKPC